jgi:hypothetical protein
VWSAGVKTESSIYRALLNDIENSKYFIYFENQYFISKNDQNANEIVENCIGAALMARLTRAIERKEVTFELKFIYLLFFFI